MTWMKVLASGGKVVPNNSPLSAEDLRQTTIDCIKMCRYVDEDYKEDSVEVEKKSIAETMPKPTVPVSNSSKDANEITNLDSMVDVDNSKDTREDKKQKKKRQKKKKPQKKGNMDPEEFEKLQNKTRDSVGDMWKEETTNVLLAINQVQHTARSIIAEPDVFGTAGDHLIIVPPTSEMQLYACDQLPVCMLEWFSLSLSKSSDTPTECKFLAPSLILESEGLMKIKTYLMEAIDQRLKGMYLAPYFSSGRWSLIVICPEAKFIVVMDPEHKGNPRAYQLVNILEKCFPEFKSYAKKMPQQSITRHNPYCVMHYMWLMIRQTKNQLKTFAKADDVKRERERVLSPC